jgi:hypothetical protein
VIELKTALSKQLTDKNYLPQIYADETQTGTELITENLPRRRGDTEKAKS